MVTDDGDLPLELPAEPERNRARKTALVAWTKLVAGARMVGDERLADARPAGIGPPVRHRGALAGAADDRRRAEHGDAPDRALVDADDHR